MTDTLEEFVTLQAQLDWPEQDGFSARDHIKAAAPDDERLRTVPPPATMHLWAQFCELSANRQPAFSGVAPITWADLAAWMQVAPVAKTAWKARALMQIDQAVRREWSKKARAGQHAKASNQGNGRR